MTPSVLFSWSVAPPTYTHKNGTLVVYIRDPVKIFKQEPIAALEYSFSSWPLSVNRVKVKSIECMQKLLGKWTYQTNGSLKKSESWCTLIILASIIFSLFQMKPLQTDKNGLLPFPLLPATLPYTAWLTAESAAHTEGKGQQMSRRRMVPPLFSSLSADTKVSLERLKLVTILNSLYLAHFLLLYLLSSSLGCHSLQLGKKGMLAPLGDWKNSTAHNNSPLSVCSGFSNAKPSSLCFWIFRKHYL